MSNELMSDSDRGVQTLKSEMLSSLDCRCQNIETNETLVHATMLAIFKDKFFSSMMNTDRKG